MKLRLKRRDAYYGSGWRSALWLGVPFGLLMGAFTYATTGSVFGATFQALFGLAFFGPMMRWLARRYWPGARSLDSTDRLAVQEMVRHGGPVPDARLAPAVLEYVEVVRSAQARDRRYWWVLGLVGIGTLLLAVTATIGGPARGAVVWWVVVVFWIVFLGSSPRRQRRILSRATHAEADAQDALQLP